MVIILTKIKRCYGYDRYMKAINGKVESFNIDTKIQCWALNI